MTIISTHQIAWLRHARISAQMRAMGHQVPNPAWPLRNGKAIREYIMLGHTAKLAYKN